jgi:ElaA protein
MTLHWVLKPFNELTSAELYAIMRLRNEVFVLEQNCVYQDADDKDQPSWHLAGWDGQALVAYTRIIPPGTCYESASIGRVVVSPAYRNMGMGRILMTVSIDKTFDLFNGSSIEIGAQLYLQSFYQSLGFIVSGPQYLEDGIPHIQMQLKK